MIDACVGDPMGRLEEEQEEEVAVFVDTNVGTRLAVSVPSGITVADFKRVVEGAHIACFPDYGEITIEGVMVRRKSCLYHLPSLVPLKCFFRKKQSSWILHVSLRCLEGTLQPCHASWKNQVPIVATITRTNDQGGEYDITEAKKSSRQRQLPPVPSTEDCKIREQNKRKRKHLLKEPNMEHWSKKMEDDPVANVKTACVGDSSAISSDILSVGGIITRYFTDFSEVSSFDRCASSSLVPKPVKSLPRAQLGVKLDKGCSKIQLDNPIPSTVQTPPQLISPPLSAPQDNSIPSDYIHPHRVGRSLLKAKTELEKFSSPQRPLISLFKTEGARPVDISLSPIKFSVFEISEDDD
ncbi:hypothetical protein MLD38_022108 [Melastoma candidum]|uniref:Uncharacterized protein n=1 Tax=Melastoma candidum TaxID=119954 RepID=A0ACB9QLL5_9MYRT|nr:hypothetical protein MLD38_022108 [Melastoma candidum]